MQKTTSKSKNGNGHGKTTVVMPMGLAQPEEKKTDIRIPPLHLGEVTITLTGDTPLLMCRFDEKVRRMIEDKQQGKAKQKKAPRDPQADFEASIYRCPVTNKVGFPATGLKNALVRAGTYADEKMTYLKGVCHIVGDLDGGRLCSIIGTPRMRADNVRPQPGTTTVAYRAEFAPWSMIATIRFNANAVTAEQLINLVNIAGFSTGIGSWRPERNGTMGMFHVGE